MQRYRSIGLTAKLIIAVTLSSLLTYILVFGIGLSLTERVIIKEVKKTGESVVDAAAKQVDDIVDVVARATKSMDFVLKNRSSTDEDLFYVIKFLLSNNEELSGLSISFEPYLMDPKMEYYSPYCFKKDGEIRCEMLGSDSYDYFDMDWYEDAKVSGEAAWTDPYLDSDYSDVFIVSHSAPFFKKDGDREVFEGVVSADVSITWLQDMMSKVALKSGGYVFLISQKGDLITFPKAGYALEKNIWEMAPKKIATDMTQGRSGITPMKDFITGERSWMFYKPVKLTNWSIGVVFKERDLFANAFFIAYRMILLCIMGTLLLFAVVFIISRRITKPIILLSSAAGKIARGDMDTNIPALNRRDEIGRLARAFTSMQKDLKKYITELTQTVAKQERIDNELKIAHDIQQNIVPEQFPSFGSQGNVRAFGKLVPAREVGGDLYDCFEIDDKHTFFVIGDVSDKGVHAAMIMAIVSTLLRGLSKNLKDPDQMLGIVNRQVLKRNRESMFVTLFCGILDNETGDFRYANAGHVPPVLLRKNEPPLLITELSGMALGIDPEAEYPWKIMKLSDGDKIFMYTDGVTDAVNEKDELFGDELLLNVLESEDNVTPEQLVKDVFKAVEGHALNRSLPDDIAILSFSFEKCSCIDNDRTSIRIKNSSSEIGRVAKMIDDFGKGLDCGREMLSEVDLVVEEIVINIIKYAYDDKDEHAIDVSLELANDHFIVKIVDDGKPFDPLKSSLPNTGLTLKDRPIGGLGIFFAKKLADKLYYERTDDRNRITLVKIIKEGPHARPK